MRREDLASNLLALRSALQQAIEESGRSAESVRLMAVSKTHPYEAMLALRGAGQLLFGENRVQEGAGKLPPKEQRSLAVNLIGHLQSNKARKAVALFDRIDSVDSLSLARRLHELVNTPYPILLELNTSGEAAKHGFAGEDALFSALDAIVKMPNLRVEGLLTLGPLGGDERATRASFAALRRTFSRARERFDLPSFYELSMGMSGDWRLAVAEGSTCVRVGSLLFGAREG